MKIQHDEIRQYKEAFEALCGHQISEQEAFDALYEQTELFRILDEIDRALPQKDVHIRPDEDTPFQGGIK